MSIHRAKNCLTSISVFVLGWPQVSERLNASLFRGVGNMRSSKKSALFRFAFLAIFAITLLLSSGSANAQLSAGSVTGIFRVSCGTVVACATVQLLQGASAV